jgi:hypothetical protein
MGIFEILSEARIKEWLAKPKLKANRKRVEKLEEKSFEGHLLDQIRTLIKDAAVESGEKRARLLAEANGLEIQLLISLEQGGHLLMAKKTQQLILQHKIKYLNI